MHVKKNSYEKFKPFITCQLNNYNFFKKNIDKIDVP